MVLPAAQFLLDEWWHEPWQFPSSNCRSRPQRSGGTVALGSTKAALGDRLGQIINVKTDFGAAGDGSADDTAAIQAALDAAFGPASSPHGDTNRSLNRPVYFPAGNYKSLRRSI